MGADARAPDSLDIIERSAEADRLDDRRRARLEAMRGRIIGDDILGDVLDHLPPAVEGRQILQ